MTTGTDIIGALLTGNGPLVAVVPLGNIKEDELPEKAPLTAVLVRTISSVDRQPVEWSVIVHSTDRVAVTVRAGSTRERKRVIGLVRAACSGFVGDIAGATQVSVRSAGLGPALTGPGGTFEQTQDFKVAFNAPQ